MKLYVPLGDLRRETEPAAQRASGNREKSGAAQMKALSIKTELDVRGMTVDEAIPVIERQIHDAILAKQNQFSIIHGKGTGALRAGIQGYLKTCKAVASYRLGSFGEGDTGVTIVTLK